MNGNDFNIYACNKIQTDNDRRRDSHIQDTEVLGRIEGRKDLRDQMQQMWAIVFSAIS
jgi:hypothetical protein